MLIEAIRARGMGMAKRKGEKVRGERNFAGRRKIGVGGGQKCTCTRECADVGGRNWREKQTYIAPCVVPTLAEEFGHRLRPAEENRNERGAHWASRTTTKLMAPPVPHFSISLDYEALSRSLFSYSYLSPFFAWASAPGRPPGVIGTTTELPINNWLLNYYRTF